jgi:hypothetical protein
MGNAGCWRNNVGNPVVDIAGTPHAAKEAVNGSEALEVAKLAFGAKVNVSGVDMEATYRPITVEQAMKFMGRGLNDSQMIEGVREQYPGSLIGSAGWTNIVLVNQGGFTAYLDIHIEGVGGEWGIRGTKDADTSIKRVAF